VGKEEYFPERLDRYGIGYGASSSSFGPRLNGLTGIIE
jgi:hypothetical protein